MLKDHGEGLEIQSGELECKSCGACFPILSGVAILVDDVQAYLSIHAKGISKFVEDSDIPERYRDEYLEAKEEAESLHIDEDLESERVNALYLMTHYLKVQGSAQSWWENPNGSSSPLIGALIREHWDQGPFYQIGKLANEYFGRPRRVVELGCGVGGLLRVLGAHAGSYLGVDSSFASIMLARHLNLGTPYPGKIRIPEDLLFGTVSREITIPESDLNSKDHDFVVGEIENLPLRPRLHEVSIALNAIDMLDEPEVLPRAQKELTGEGGIVIQSCPYIWHEKVSKKLRAKIVSARVSDVLDSAALVKWLYERSGMQILQAMDHVPWLFLKHPRQLEIYSVHLFVARSG